MLLIPATALLLPIAIAFACSPLAHVELNLSRYQAGGTVTVTGTNFLADTPVTFSVGGGPVLASVTASSTGYVTATFPLPAYARNGDAVLATARDIRTGQPFSASGGLVIEEPAPVAEPTQAAPALEPAADNGVTASEPAAGVTGAAPHRAARPAHRSAPLSATTRSPVRSAAAARQQSRAATGAATTGAEPPVLAASVPATAARRSAGAGQAPAHAWQPSVRSVTSDLWSNFETARRPSLATAAAPTPATDNGLGNAGLLLLIVGAGVLAAGIAFRNTQRRAAAADTRR